MLRRNMTKVKGAGRGGGPSHTNGRGGMVRDLLSRATFKWDLSLQLDIPIKPVDPAFVQMVRRKGAAIVL
jgi:hypothetical protein